MQQQRKGAKKNKGKAKAKKVAAPAEGANHAPPLSAQTAPPAIPPILRWMAGEVEAAKMSPMMLFAGLMQMVHMERQLETADADTKLAFGELLKGTVSSDVVGVFVHQCYENAHPEEAAAQRAKAATEPAAPAVDAAPAAPAAPAVDV
jgi:hypothetical protein